MCEDGREMEEGSGRKDGGKERDVVAKRGIVGDTSAVRTGCRKKAI